MADYYVDSAAAGANDGTSWTDAWTSPNSLPSLFPGDNVYIDDSSVDGFTYVGDRSWTGPGVGLPAKIFSVASGTTGPVVKSTSNQFDTSNGAFDLTFNGAFTMYGVQVKSGASIVITPDKNETQGVFDDCNLLPGDGSFVHCKEVEAQVKLVNCTIDCTQDTGTPAGPILYPGPYTECLGLNIVNATLRDGAVLDLSLAQYGISKIEGGDWSSLTNATSPELVELNNLSTEIILRNILLPASWSAWFDPGTINMSGRAVIENCGSGDQPEDLHVATLPGELHSSTLITRTDGLTIEGTAVSWNILTSASATIDTPFVTPWLYAIVESTGTKTVNVFITHDANPAADYTDLEIWLEVQYKDLTTGEWTYVSDRGGRLATAADQTDDVASTWNGAGPSFTYKQNLSIAGLTVGATGIIRGRVCVAVPSVVTGDDLYIDPKLIIT